MQVYREIMMLEIMGEIEKFDLEWSNDATMFVTMFFCCEALRASLLY